MKTISFNNQKTLVEKFNVSNNSIDYTFELTMNFTIVDTDLEIYKINYEQQPCQQLLYQEC